VANWIGFVVETGSSCTPAERIELIFELKDHRKVVPSPVRRVWLSKDGKPIKPDFSNARPLGIPTMYDRAAQALWGCNKKHENY